jgi:antagonist of KipI
LKAITVIKPGPLTTVQDAGRPGLQRYGIPSSGAMDQFAYRIANLLVGNPPGGAALEVMLPGLVIEAQSRLIVAITGADLAARRSEEAAPFWTTFTMERGEQLSFTHRKTGCRAYVAVRGGFEAAEFLGSKSTFLKGRMGAPLKAGDTLSTSGFLPPASKLQRSLPEQFRPALASPQAIRVILGPQTDSFTQRGLDTFHQAVYSISPRSDRQGIRTEGPPIESERGPDIISDPTPLGAIQVPGDGKPIILHRDGQVTGGYAKIGKVIAADLDRFGQMVPGDSIRFAPVSRDEALRLAEEARRQMDVIAALVGG